MQHHVVPCVTHTTTQMPGLDGPIFHPAPTRVGLPPARTNAGTKQSATPAPKRVPSLRRLAFRQVLSRAPGIWAAIDFAGASGFEAFSFVVCLVGLDPCRQERKNKAIMHSGEFSRYQLCRPDRNTLVIFCRIRDVRCHRYHATFPVSVVGGCIEVRNGYIRHGDLA